MPTLKYGDEEMPIEKGESMKEQCEKLGVPFCCDEGICGTCVIRVEEGMEHLTPRTKEEEDFLWNLESERLACQCKVKQDAPDDAVISIKY